jgi:amino acid permease
MSTPNNNEDFSASSLSSSKKNNNVDAYFNNSPSSSKKSKSASPVHSSLDKNSKVMNFLNNQKINGRSPHSLSSKNTTSDSKSSLTITEKDKKKGDVLDDLLENNSERAPSETSDSDVETATETETEDNNSVQGKSIRFNDYPSPNRINIKKQQYGAHEGYMSLPVHNEELSRSSKGSFVDNYSKSIDDWAVSYKKTFKSKMDNMLMNYSEFPPSLKAYRKKIKNRKNHPELYAAEEGIALNDEYNSIVNYDEDTTTETKPDHTLESSSTEIIQAPEESSETCPLIPKPEDLEKKSSFTQSCFNSVNVLMGIGLISFPFAFYLTGWIVGVIMLVAFALLTMHTAKILGKCMSINNLTNYSEIGYAAFGKKGYIFISLFFSFELFACSVSLIILIADSLVALFPSLDGTMIKVLSFFFITPLTYPKHLGALAWGSLIGIFAIANLATILFYDGFSKKDYPGSLITPAETYLLPVNLMRVPLTIGILMAGFSGHSVFPTIYHDMREPKKYNSVVNISYTLTLILYFLVAAAGYAMFGENTLPEITQNIAEVPVYSRFVNRLTIWLMVINPITKYGVNLIPLNANVEQIYGPLIDCCSESVREFIRISGRTIISFLVVFVAIVFPEFHQVLCLLGSLFSMIICVIFPCMCYSVLYKGRLSPGETLINNTIIIVSSIIAIIGTVWAFIPNIL